MSAQNHPFVMFPTRIWNLPGITLQLLKFYEKIFQFWHQGRECFLSNSVLMEYAGMSSASSVSEAFQYFEEHGEMKRVMKDGRRYVIPPQPRLNVDQDNEVVDNASGKGSTPLATARPPSRHSETPPLATARHNNINIIKQINKSSYASPSEKKKAENGIKHVWSDSRNTQKTKNESHVASVTSQTTSYDPHRETRASRASNLLEAWMAKNPLKETSQHAYG